MKPGGTAPSSAVASSFADADGFGFPARSNSRGVTCVRRHIPDNEVSGSYAVHRSAGEDDLAGRSWLKNLLVRAHRIGKQQFLANNGPQGKLLANNGRVIVIGSRGEVTINPRELMGRRASIRAFTLWAITAAEEADIHAGVFAGLENGTLRPVVGKELPLAEAARAHKEILEPGSAGKIVLIC